MKKITFSADFDERALRYRTVAYIADEPVGPAGKKLRFIVRALHIRDVEHSKGIRGYKSLTAFAGKYRGERVVFAVNEKKNMVVLTYPKDQYDMLPEIEQQLFGTTQFDLIKDDNPF